jgi:predicted RNase H-like HicB family nuclease
MGEKDVKTKMQKTLTFESSDHKKLSCNPLQFNPEDTFIYRRHKYCIGEGYLVSRKFTAFLESAEEGGFVVKCLELPVATQGETKEEALKNIKEAIEGYLEAKTKLFGRKIKGEKVEVVVEAPTALLA